MHVGCRGRRQRQQKEDGRHTVLLRKTTNGSGSGGGGGIKMSECAAVDKRAGVRSPLVSDSGSTLVSNVQSTLFSNVQSPLVTSSGSTVTEPLICGVDVGRPTWQPLPSPPPSQCLEWYNGSTWQPQLNLTHYDDVSNSNNSSNCSTFKRPTPSPVV